MINNKFWNGAFIAFCLSISIYPNLRLSFYSFLFLLFRFQGFWWSPCSSKIAYTESDESSIPEFVINHQVIEKSVLKKRFYSLIISSIFFYFLLFFVLHCRVFFSPLILFYSTLLFKSSFLFSHNYLFNFFFLIPLGEG